MASLNPTDDPESPTAHNDPFVAAPTPALSSAAHHRFSNFDSQLFALGPNASPAQAKRALEAHLADTVRRMEEAGKLGTALVQQRKELTERIKDVEQMQAEGELSDDLRQKLIEIEKDYNEVARESARAFLPKQRVPSNEAANAASPFALESKGGRRSVSPSKFEAQATGSPTKLSVPNRKVRNQPANRVHDIEFAAEISTSLISQVRNLQGLLSEKEEELKEVKADKSKLEYEAEGFQQRVRTLDESEHRYKDENWNLETQVHELMAAQKEAVDREKKMSQTLSILQAEKTSTQRELDEVKLGYSKLSEEHTAAVKQYDIDLGTAKRNMVMADSERSTLQRKIEDLVGQNQELAKAYSSQRGRATEREQPAGLSDEDFDTAQDNMTPEHSPPPSPVKGTPRHSMLESETLKTSLGHAQRTIQSLRTNYHREKTEKLELRRMLQDARDEIEKARHDPLGTSNKRARKTDSKEFKKPPRLLGGLRSARSEIFADDPNWEDQSDSGVPAHHSLPTRGSRVETDSSDHFETANDTSDAFETANERDTETDDFHTGAEDMSSDEGAQTETESPSKRRTIGARPSNFTSSMIRSPSIHSTASTEDEDYPFDSEHRTPTSLPPLQAKFPLRVSRGAYRRSRQASEEPALASSPASIATSSVIGTPQQPAQSLAAELGDLDASDNESNLSATPSRRSTRGRTVSPPPAVPPLPKAIMVDSGMMTDPLPASGSSTSTNAAERPMSMDTVVSRLSTSTFSDAGTIDMQENLAKFPSPPKSPPKQEDFEFSTVHAETVEPIAQPDRLAGELEALRNQHAQTLETMRTEQATAQANALEALRTELSAAHDVALENLNAEHVKTQTRALESLEAEHAKAQTAAIQDLRSEHATALEELRANHAAAQAAALESLRSEHDESMKNLQGVSTAARVAAMEALESKHSEQIKQLEVQGAIAQQKALDALQGSHVVQQEQVLAEARQAHLDDLEKLRATQAEEAREAAEAVQTNHARELDALRTTHTDQLAAQTSESKVALDAQMVSLAAKHDDEIAAARKASDEAHAAQIAALVASHSSEIEATKSRIAASHTEELGALEARLLKEADVAKQKAEVSHTNAIEALKANQLREVEQARGDSDATHRREVESLKQEHDRMIEELRKDQDTKHAAETELLAASHSTQLESTRAEANATLAKELASLKDIHAEELRSLNSKHAETHARELEGFKAALAKQVDSSRAEGDAAHAEQLEALNAAHGEIIDAHKRDTEKARAQDIAVLQAKHGRDLEDMRRELMAAKSAELLELTNSHSRTLDDLRAELNAFNTKSLEDASTGHTQELEALKREAEATKDREVASLQNTHSDELRVLRAEIEAQHAGEVDAINKQHEEARAEAMGALSRQLQSTSAVELETVKQELEATRLKETEALVKEHADRDADRLKAQQELESAHASALVTLQRQHEISLGEALDALSSQHASDLATLADQHGATKATALQELEGQHLVSLERLTRESEAREAKQVETVKSEHTHALERLRQESWAERDRLLAKHAAELDALRQSLTITRPALTLSSMNAVETEPIEPVELRSPRREAFIIPREAENASASISVPLGQLGPKGRATSPQILEDETSQSLDSISGHEAADSQRPFKEVSANTNARSSRQQADQSSQTALTSMSMDRMMRKDDSVTPHASLYANRSQDSFDSVIRVKPHADDMAAVSAPEPVPLRRPGSSTSARSTQHQVPPLPANHREAIEAARTGSSSGARGTMGPPLMPASAYKNPVSRPRTPSHYGPNSPPSGRGTPTPRAGSRNQHSISGVHSPTRTTVRSRRSSISSFASEVDTRFNIRNDMSMDAAGLGPGTDPRMIQAITQTMIGEYLWKYTRKAGRGEMSEKRHRRYFWVHPYTRTLYWSDRDPSAAGRAELKAKSVPIEAVRVVTDDNPMPPGLHRKSLVVISPGRTVKFTCTTGQRHETWFNALSYLLLRTGTENQADTEEMAGNITQDDVDEFNPSILRRPANGNRSQAPPSLSSYNSRTTRNESPNIDMSMSIPTLTATHEKGATRSGTLSKISGYWKASSISSTFGSRRGRGHGTHDNAIYEASEVHDSAEDLRQMIEQQDRESDRLENVRACCDGKHDVGTLSHNSKRGRLSNLHAHTHTHPGPSAATTPMSTLRSRA